ELFYSCESLKLFNCIETKEMIIHLARYLFPEEIVKKISTSKEIVRKKRIVRCGMALSLFGSATN
ncbi:hypothetical protein LCGC14_1587570, partial [marine sediment metagenome]